MHFALFSRHYIEERSGVLKELEHPVTSVPKGRRFCTICGEIKRETHFEGDSTHCKACCENMLHTKVRVYGVLVFVCMLVLCAAAVFLGVHTVSFCMTTRRADDLAQEKLLYDACDLYENAVSGISDINRSLLLRGEQTEEEESADAPLFFTPGTHTWERYCAVYARTQSDYEAATLIENSLNADAVKKNAAFSGFIEAKKAYEDVYARVDAVSQENPYESIRDMPYDKVIAVLDEAEKENDSSYYKGYAQLFKGSATQYYHTDDPASALPYYEKALEYLPDEYGNIYSAQAQIAQQTEDWKLLRSAGERMLECNRSYTDAYEWLVYASVRLNEPDAAQSACDALHAVAPESVLYDKLLTLSALLQGDADKAALCRDEAAEKWNQKASETFSTMLADQALPAASQRFMREYAQFASYAAIVCLLEGDNEAALDWAYERGFNYGYYLEYLTGAGAITQQTIDIAYICASLTKDQDVSDTVSQMGEPGEAAQQVIDGKLSLRQAFLGEEAQLL